jgi:hypothetical protein
MIVSVSNTSPTDQTIASAKAGVKSEITGRRKIWKREALFRRASLFVTTKSKQR